MELDSVLPSWATAQENQTAGLRSGGGGARPVAGTAGFDARSSDVNLSDFGATQVQALTAAEIVNGINASLSNAGIAIEKIDPAQFTPEAVANRILARIEDALVGVTENARRSRQVLSQAREGVADGIDRARDILKALGDLNDTTEDGIRRTGDLIDRGLRRIEDGIARRFGSDTVTAEQRNTANNQGSEEQVLQSTVAQSAVSAQQTADISNSGNRNRPTF